MVDDLVLAQSGPASFRAVAEATGIALRRQLQEHSNSARKQVRLGYESYEFEPYCGILETVMKRFREHEFQPLPNGSNFEWRTIRFITQDATLDEAKLAELPMNLWALPLLVGKHNTVGQPVRLCELSKMCEGDIYFGYEVTQA